MKAFIFACLAYSYLAPACLNFVHCKARKIQDQISFSTVV